MSKVTSLKNVALAQEAHIIGITETTTINPPKLEGYEWFHKTRTENGGGVGLLIKQDLIKYVQLVENMEDTNQEIKWIQLKNGNRTIYVGIYYGKQENAKIEQIMNEFSQLRTQITKLKQTGSIILMGDFNAKIKVDIRHATQPESRNGKYLQELIETTQTYPTNLQSKTGLWTRENRNNESEKSIIDYILTTADIANNVENIEVDEAGTHRLKGKKQSDHNTITLTHTKLHSI